MKKNRDFTTSLDISNADIYVEVASAEIIPELTEEYAEEMFCIVIDGNVLRTPKGNPIIHSNERALREFVGELEYEDELNVQQISLYNLLCSQIDFVEDNMGNETLDSIEAQLLNDPVLKLIPGPEKIEQLNFYHEVEKYLSKRNTEHPRMPACLLEDYRWFSKAGLENFKAIASNLFSDLSKLNSVQKTVFTIANSHFGSPILSILASLRLVTAKEFALTYLASQCLNSKIWSNCDRKEEQKFLKEITLIIECMNRYLENFSPRKSDL